MPIQQWSREILLLDMRDEPQFSEDLQQVAEQLDDRPCDVVANLAAVTQISSTGLGDLLQLRQRLVNDGRQLRLCSVPDVVWSVMLVTSLDKVLDFSPDVSSALASLQLDKQTDAEEE
ncbi:MAG: STAS domain-containing protein [Phycisphaeraceae bacterium]